VVVVVVVMVVVVVVGGKYTRHCIFHCSEQIIDP
jgi:hypothetical protein